MDKFNDVTIRSALAALWQLAGQTQEWQTRHCEATIVAMQAFKPADEIEGMIAAQAVALHAAAMECNRRPMIPDQPFGAALGYRKIAANASRAFVELLSALDRKRGKGQVVRVERVVGQEGGQAIYGNVQTGVPQAAAGAPTLAIEQKQPGISPENLICPRREGEGV